MSAIRVTRSVLTSAALLLAPVISQAQQLTWSWHGDEPTQNGRLTQNGVASSYLLAPKAYPGTINAASQFLYVSFTFQNTAATTKAFFVDIIGVTDGSASYPSANASSTAVAYLGSFSPTNVATNYLGDAGSPCSGPFVSGGTQCNAAGGGPLGFSVLLGAGQVAVLVLSRTAPFAVPIDAIGGDIGPSITVSTRFGDVSTVPEPSTYALMAFGLAGMGIGARRRRRELTQ